jgi:hypothetical protein
MNGKEKYEMIAMCAKAFADGKKLQFVSSDGVCSDIQITGLMVIANNIMYSDYIYRIKPEPKTQTIRPAWMHSPSRADRYLNFTQPQHYDLIESSDLFIKWADEEKTYEVPE